MQVLRYAIASISFFVASVPVAAQNVMGCGAASAPSSWHGGSVLPPQTSRRRSFSDVGKARIWVNKILTAGGLATGKFTLRELPGEQNAFAYVEPSSCKRIIAYGPEFMADLDVGAKSSFARISVLAHEVGHHVNFHLLGSQQGRSRVAEELEADVFSGFVMARLGRSLTDAQAAMRALARNCECDINADSDTHPAFAKRFSAIKDGWERGSGTKSTSIEQGVSKAPRDPVERRRQRDTELFRGVRPNSIWNHNGSVMGLVARGKRRQFIYVKPRPSLRKWGIREGDVLFVGERRRNRYVGVAYLRRPDCPVAEFSVTGEVRNNSRTVIVRGRMPVRDGLCRVTGARNNAQRFDYVRVVR